MGQRAVGRWQGLRTHAERERLFRSAVVEHAVGRMQVDGRSRVRLETRNAEDVVDVGVGQPDGNGGDAIFPEAARDQVRFLTRIDHGALTGGVVDHEVAVLDELAVDDRDDPHGQSGSVARYFSTAIAAVVASPTAVVI